MEVSGSYYTFTQLNDNTYKTLQSTEHIEYLEPWLQEELQRLSFMQNALLSINEKATTLYMQGLIDFQKIYPFNKEGRIISEQQADLVLKDLSNAQKISALNILIVTKMGAYESILTYSEPLEEKMIWLADTLMVEYPFLKN